jgi:RNA polymerase sigma-70 factor (ECF subfamily)
MPDIDFFLWSRIQSGDTGVFEILFQKYHASLCLLSKRYTKDMASARDIVQALFIHLWEKRASIIIEVSLRAYLYRAVRFNSIRYLENDRKIGIRTEEMPEMTHDPEFFDNIEYIELQRVILDTIESLPEQCRKVFTLSRNENLKYTEIAEVLQISVKTVESHISKALKILHENLRSR